MQIKLFTINPTATELQYYKISKSVPWLKIPSSQDISSSGIEPLNV